MVAVAAGGCASGPSAARDGLRRYYIVFLRPNPSRKPIPVAERQRIQAAHMANINKMADDGILVAAGPMEDDPATISGIFVFNSPSLKDASGVAALDPTVVEGRNTVDAHEWIGPAGIGDRYFSEKKANSGMKAVMAAHAFCILKRGPSWSGSAGAGGARELFVESLRSAGALGAAGPVVGDPAIEWIVIFKSQSLEEAKRSLERDPDVRAGRLSVEYHRWWSADGVLPW
jgi:uncharacterized protein YciI